LATCYSVNGTTKLFMTNVILNNCNCCNVTIINPS
jgi:hypothetical protein